MKKKKSIKNDYQAVMKAIRNGNDPSTVATQFGLRKIR